MEKSLFNRRELKQLLLLVVFGLFIILVQVFQFLNTRKNNLHFLEIVNNTNSLVIKVNDILRESSTLQRSLLNISMSDDSLEYQAMQSRIRTSEDMIERLMEEIRKDTLVKQHEVSGLFDNLKKNYIRYRGTFQVFLQYIQKGDEEKLNSFRKNELRQSLNTFQQSQTDFLDLMIKIENEQISKVGDAATKTSWKLLLGGSGVLFLILIFLIYIIVSESKKIKDQTMM